MQHVVIFTETDRGRLGRQIREWIEIAPQWTYSFHFSTTVVNNETVYHVLIEWMDGDDSERVSMRRPPEGYPVEREA